MEKNEAVGTTPRDSRLCEAVIPNPFLPWKFPLGFRDNILRPCNEDQWSELCEHVEAHWSLGTGPTFHLSSLSVSAVTAPPRMPRGGILVDEMDMGKTMVMVGRTGQSHDCDRYRLRVRRGFLLSLIHSSAAAPLKSR